MKIDILSLFPEMFKGPLTQSIVGKAIEKQLLDVEVTDFRDYTTNKQRHVDDTPYGGGAGMLLQAQPIYDALDAIAAKNDGLGKVTDEISLGDFVLTGGELGAMVVIDATVRLLPDVLGNRESALGDSFSMGLLEYPQYTRPADFRGMKVPEVLTSGNHQKIAEWRNKEALRRTYERRPDLLENYELSAQEEKWLREFKTLEVNDDE